MKLQRSKLGLKVLSGSLGSCSAEFASAMLKVIFISLCVVRILDTVKCCSTVTEWSDTVELNTGLYPKYLNSEKNVIVFFGYSRLLR